MSPVVCNLSSLPCNIAEACPEGLFGAGCEEHCDCGDNVSCHHVTGACDCPRGWRGRRCEKGESIPASAQLAALGRGDRGSSQSLGRRETLLSISCGKRFCGADSLPGKRLLGCCKTCCPGPWALVPFGCQSGDFHLLPCCPTACLPGSFGRDCASRCACPLGVPCHHVSGRCGCPPGFTGSGCETRMKEGVIPLRFC